MSEKSIFQKIIDKEIPADIVYEDDLCLAFHDIDPKAPTHVLVIPKEPAETLGTLSDDAAAAVGRVLPRICRAVQRATGVDACNVLQNNGAEAGQEVMHVHFHVIPKYAGKNTGGGLHKSWDPTVPEGETLADLGRKIARLL